MPLIQHVYPWDSQPQEAVEIDWSNPLARGLSIAVLPSRGLVNLALNVAMSAGAMPASGVAEPGSTWTFDRASATPIDTGERSSNITEHSAFVIARHRLLSSVNDEAYLGNRVSANNGFLFFTTGAAGSLPTQSFFLAIVHGGVAVYESTVRASARVNETFVAMGFSSTVGSNVRFFSAGALLGAQVVVGAMNSSADTLRIGRDVNASGLPAHYETPLMLYWRRRLSDDEHAQIANNPWQLFAPRTQYVPTASGAPVPTLGIPTFVPGSLTSSGFRPRVPSTWA